MFGPQDRAFSKERIPHGENAAQGIRHVEFLNSAGARTVRMLAEYIEPKNRLDRNKMRDTIVFFGSARFSDAKVAARVAASAKTPAEVQEAQRLQATARYYEEARELACKLTRWSEQCSPTGRRFVVCSGGGPGIMEAANRGAQEAGGISVGFNISLPLEQAPNPYITRGLSFQFHYFFMRKLWFAYLAKALVVFPGGYGTLDEMMEALTLVQTEKLKKKMLVVVYGSEYWKRVINFDAMQDMGTIDASDRKLFRFADSPTGAFDLITSWLEKHYL